MTHKKFLFTLHLLILSFGATLFAGTNIIVGKKASADGSTFCTYSADSYYLYGELIHYPATEYPKYTMTDIFGWDTRKYQGKIKQVLRTHSMIGNINEHQVCITESTFGGRPELIDTTGILDYGNLIYITLQRSKTAKCIRRAAARQSPPRPPHSLSPPAGWTMPES